MKFGSQPIGGGVHVCSCKCKGTENNNERKDKEQITMNQLKLKDIPSDLMAKIDEQFNQHPKIRGRCASNNKCHQLRECSYKP